MASLQVPPVQPVLQVQTLGCVHVPCAVHSTLSQTGVLQTSPDQPLAHEHLSGATHSPLMPQSSVQMGLSQVAPDQPSAQVQVLEEPDDECVHLPWLPHGMPQMGVSHFPGGPIPFAHTEQSFEPHPI